MPGPQLPGLQSGTVFTPRQVLVNPEGAILIPGALDSAKGIDGGNTPTYDIREGWLLGLITAAKQWVPLKRTTANGAGVASTSLIVANSHAFRAGDQVVVGVNPAQPIVSVNYTTQTITLTNAISWSNLDVVRGTDGSQTARGILHSFARLRNQENTTDADQAAVIIVAGLVRTGLILGDLLEARADTGNQLKNILFTDQHGLG